ncbi:TPR repeat domain-containing protein [Chloropicon primus]|uniref:TPR repeat domain-containing protein n=1 Tax=Chloropicon primus TaxID=1764295 RepID=A0A5B8MEV3_9CHLO|nr:TPR repeat domain-containing protein [Chloropicon primus]UPQ98135.1 TPR repeat domain-containing protein [Chloropicon primus]|eukprot:QDZ18927.1 TPR repeat domain-containing protein [Chloropicon primus]
MPSSGGEVETVTIKPELLPDFTSFDRSDPDLRRVYEMIQGALRAENVVEEEARWTEVIERYGSNGSNWANDAVGRAYGNRGNCRSRQGRFEEAIGDYNKSIELCPYSVDPVLNRGVAYEGIKEYKLAIEDYKAVLDVSPSDPAAWNNFGNANAALQNWEVAEDAFKKATSMSDVNFFSFAAVNYSIVLFQRGKDEEAIRELRKILIKYPSFTDARAALAVALWLNGDRSGAETAWYRVEDSRYADTVWLTELRHWPPRLVQGMKDFRTIST